MIIRYTNRFPELLCLVVRPESAWRTVLEVGDV